MLGLIFVTYHPTADMLSRINAMAADPAVLVCLIDNTPGHCAVPPDFGSTRLLVAHNGNRGGIAGAFNYGVSLLHDQGCNAYLTFDQDSEIPPDFIDCLSTFLNAHPHAQLVCPDVFDRNSGTHARFIKLRTFTYETATDDTAHFAISSGFYFTDQAYRNIGAFDERLVIDHVDTDFCLRARERGYTIHVNRATTLNHSIGKREKRRLCFITIKPNHHASQRRFYIARNGTYLARRHWRTQPSFIVLNALRLGHEIIGIVFFEQNKLAKLSSIAKGCLQGLLGRLGPAGTGR